MHLTALLLFLRGAEATMAVAVGLVRCDLVSIHRFPSFAEEVSGEAVFCPMWDTSQAGPIVATTVITQEQQVQPLP